MRILIPLLLDIYILWQFLLLMVKFIFIKTRFKAVSLVAEFVLIKNSLFLKTSYNMCKNKIFNIVGGSYEDNNISKQKNRYSCVLL